MQNMVRSLVVRLFIQSGPSAVFGAVIAIIIYTVKRAFFAGGFAHIGEEVFKDLPAFADLDTASAIVGVTFKVGISAAGAHIAPDGIHAGFGHAVSAICIPGPDAVIASTTVCVAGSQFFAFGHNT